MPDTEASIGYGITFEMADPATPATRTYIAEIFDVTPPADTTDMVEGSHMASPNKSREYIDGMSDSGEASLEMNLVPGSVSDRALIAAKNKRKICYLTFPNGCACIFTGLRQNYEKTAPIDDRMTASVTFKVSGEPFLTDPTAPRNLVVPAIAGTAKVGVPLTLDGGIWAGAQEVTYQWKVDGANVAGATGLSYVPVTGNLGKPVTCTVTGANDSFSTDVTTVATANVVA